MAQWWLITTSILARCEIMWNFFTEIPRWLARRVSARIGREAQADTMYRGSASPGKFTQTDRSASTAHSFFICLIGIGTLQPVLIVVAAERCPATNATKVVSVQGNVTWSVINNATLQSAKLNDVLCVGDTVQVGAKSRAVLRLPNQTTIPLDQNTIFRLKESISEKEPTLIELIQGAIHVITRTPKPFKVNTPHLNALVEGTEFYVGVDDQEARVAVIEGKVNVSNEQGAVVLVDNEAATARKGQAPQKTLTIKPRDAVQWALYYPPLFDPRSRAGGENLAASHERYSRGDITGAIESLDAVPEAQRNEDYATYRAGLLLLVGRADEAEPDIERALAENGNNTDALSLKAIIAIVKNDKAKALELATQAVNIDDKSASARIALSYALQANFKIEDALKAAREATLRDADNALAWARVAELELSIPNYDKSKEAGEQAVKLNPNLARTQSILGFANLTRINIKAAKESFDRAIELDQADPLPRLGLGLATIREGKLEEGRELIEIAASLDPENSLIRSYLGKAYYEEKRDQAAGKQFELAKERDPKDPTPYLYDAIRKQSENRAVEALQDLERSIALNDQRAIYRSKLLLDQDLGARFINQSRIFGNLGFDGLALLEAHKSVSTDFGNFSAHRFLADAYSERPRHELARANEVLQSQMWQPISLYALQPQVIDKDLSILSGTGPSGVGLNEFNQLFSRNQVGLQFAALAGEQNTFGDQFLLAGVHNNMSASISQFHYETDGFRTNSQLKKDLYNAFVQISPGQGTSIHLDLRKFDTVHGDLAGRFDRDFITDFQVAQRKDLARIGGRQQIGDRTTLLASVNYQLSKDSTDSESFGGRVFSSDRKETLYEVQLNHRAENIWVIAGFGSLRGNEETTFFDIADTHKQNSSNAYLYLGTGSLPGGVKFELGVSREQVDDPNLAEEFNQTNHKVGFSWDISKGTSLRVAAFRTLKRSGLSEMTIEPTQVMGFNQFFDDSNGTDARRSVFAIDHKFSSKVFGGVELSKRDLVVVKAFTDPIEKFNWHERTHSAYLNYLPNHWLAVNLAFNYDVFKHVPELSGLDDFIETNTKRIPLTLTLIPLKNISAQLRAMYIRQSGTFLHSDFSSFEDKSSFTVTDAALSYRLPKRYGMVTVGIRNLFDKRFRFQETNLAEPTVAPQRFVFGRLSLTF
jgi:tetratricopeptide (TPR) repeat protein